MDLPDPFRSAATTSPPTCPAARSCSPPAAAASPRVRSPRSTSAGSRTTRDANVDANRERLAAATGHPRERFAYGRQVHGTTRAARDRAARPAAPGGRGGRPGDRARRRRRAGLHRRLPAGDARRRRRRRGAARRLARAGRRDRRRGRRGAARPRRGRPDHRRARPGGARLLLRGRRGGPRALRGLRRAGRASATSTSRRSPEQQLEAAGVEQVHDVGPLHDLRRPRPVLLPPPRQGVTGRQAGVVWRA